MLKNLLELFNNWKGNDTFSVVFSPQRWASGMLQRSTVSIVQGYIKLPYDKNIFVCKSADLPDTEKSVQGKYSKCTR